MERELRKVHISTALPPESDMDMIENLLQEHWREGIQSSKLNIGDLKLHRQHIATDASIFPAAPEHVTLSLAPRLSINSHGRANDTRGLHHRTGFQEDNPSDEHSAVVQGGFWRI